MTQEIEISREAPFAQPLVRDDEPSLDENRDGLPIKLPPELLRVIFEEIALSIPDAKARNHTLFNLLLISRDLYPEARRLLYRDVTFAHNTFVAGQISDALHAGAVGYVHSLRVENFGVGAVRRGSFDNMHFSRLPLNRMDGLQSLTLCGSWTSDASEVSEFLKSSIPVNSLLKFHAVMVLSDALLSFLRQQNNMQFLSLRGFDHHSTTSLRSSQLMPKLKRLALTYITNDVKFTELIEERPITVFHTDSLFHVPQYWSPFALRLQALDLCSEMVGTHYSAQVLEIVGETAVNLRLFACLEVTFYPDTVPQTMPAMFHALRHLPKLEALSVSFAAESIGQLDVMTIPDVVSTSSHLKSIFVRQRPLPGRVDQAIAQELQYDSRNGWAASRRDGMTTEDWFELSLRKLDIAYV